MICTSPREGGGLQLPALLEQLLLPEKRFAALRQQLVASEAAAPIEFLRPFIALQHLQSELTEAFLASEGFDESHQRSPHAEPPVAGRDREVVDIEQRLASESRESLEGGRHTNCLAINAREEAKRCGAALQFFDEVALHEVTQGSRPTHDVCGIGVEKL
eukprot:scaffold4592_cov169-Ochromonas_danica.AAC.6